MLQYRSFFACLVLLTEIAFLSICADPAIQTNKDMCVVFDPYIGDEDPSDIKIGKKEEFKQPTCSQSFLVKITSNEYLRNFLIFEITYKDFPYDSNLHPILIGNKGEEPPRVLIDENYNITIDADYYDINAFKNRKDYHNIVIKPQEISLGSTFYFSIYHYAESEDDYVNIPTTYTVFANSTAQFPCPRNCSGNGLCNTKEEHCECNEGFFDLDCSIKGLEITQKNYTEQTVEPNSFKVFFYEITSPEEDIKILLSKTYGELNVSYIFNRPNDYYVPNLEDQPMLNVLSNTTNDSYIVFPERIVSKHFGDTLLISIRNFGLDDIVFKTKIELYEDPVELRTVLMCIMIGVSILLIVFWGTITIVKYKIRREAAALLQTQQNAEGRDTRDILSKEDLDKYFKKKKFKEMTCTFTQNTCSICLEEFQSDTVCRQLYCEHIYHANCIENWLSQRDSCPNCKKDMRKPAIEEFLSRPKPSDEARPFLAPQNEAEANPNEIHIEMGRRDGLRQDQEEEEEKVDDKLNMSISAHLYNIPDEKRSRSMLADEFGRKSSLNKRPPPKSLNPRGGFTQREARETLANSGQIDIDEDQGIQERLDITKSIIKFKIDNAQTVNVGDKNPLPKT